MIKGIDFAAATHGVVNLELAVESDPELRFCIVKATEGQGGKDVLVSPARRVLRTFYDNWHDACDVFDIVGAYHFAHPDGDAGDAAAEALNFCPEIETAMAMKSPKRFLAALDLESKSSLNIAGQQYVDWIGQWLDEVRARLGVISMIYTGKYFWHDATKGLVAKTDRIAQCPLWLAAYVSDPDAFVADAWADWSIHQRSGNQAPGGEKPYRNPGFGGGKVDVDLDWFKGTYDDMLDFADSLKCEATSKRPWTLRNTPSEWGPSTDPGPILETVST